MSDTVPISKRDLRYAASQNFSRLTFKNQHYANKNVKKTVSPQRKTITILSDFSGRHENIYFRTLKEPLPP